MGYREGGYQGPALKIGGLVLAGLLAKVAWPAIAPLLGQQTMFAELSAADTADRRVRQDPIGAILKQRFPDDYRLLLTELQASASAHDEAGVRRAFATTMNRIAQRDGKHLTQASHESLDRLAAARSAVVAALEMRPRQCARFGAGTLDLDEVSPETHALVAAVATARLRAIAEGRDRPAGRSPVPDDATAESFVAALNGVPAPLEARQLLVGERRADQATDRANCAAERLLFDTVRRMPPESGDRILAAFLAP